MQASDSCAGKLRSDISGPFMADDNLLVFVHIHFSLISILNPTG